MKKYVKPEAAFMSLQVNERISVCTETKGLIWGGIGNYSEKHFNQYGGCATWGDTLAGS